MNNLSNFVISKEIFWKVMECYSNFYRSSLSELLRNPSNILQEIFDNLQQLNISISIGYGFDISGIEVLLEGLDPIRVLVFHENNSLYDLLSTLANYLYVEDIPEEIVLTEQETTLNITDLKPHRCSMCGALLHSYNNTCEYCGTEYF